MTTTTTTTLANQWQHSNYEGSMRVARSTFRFKADALMTVQGYGRTCTIGTVCTAESGWEACMMQIGEGEGEWGKEYTAGVGLTLHFAAGPLYNMMAVSTRNPHEYQHQMAEYAHVFEMPPPGVQYFVEHLSKMEYAENIMWDKMMAGRDTVLVVRRIAGGEPFTVHGVVQRVQVLPRDDPRNREKHHVACVWFS